MKDHKIINDTYMLILENQKGKVLRSIIHFGAHKEKRNKFFNGKKELLIEEKHFDHIAEVLCSHYKNNEMEEILKYV